MPLESGGTRHAVPGLVVSGSGTITLSATGYHWPFLVETTSITVDAIVAEVTTAGSASTVTRLGIYQAGTDWQPGALVIDAGTVASDSTGVKTASFTAKVLTQGRYLLYTACTVNTVYRSVRGTLPLGKVLIAGGTSSVDAYSYTKATPGTGALADPGNAWTTVTYNQGTMDYPCVLRITAV
jgi:hypothetical protein